MIENSIIGLFISLPLGMWLTGLFNSRLRFKYQNELPKEDEIQLISVKLIGVVERLFFTVCVAFNLGGVIVAMIGWITIKMAINQSFLINYFTKSNGTIKEIKEGLSETKKYRVRAIIGLLSGIVSMLFAVIGGIIIRHQPF